MSLERPDLKFRLDPEYHRAAKRICDVRGLTLAEYVETLVKADVFRTVHEANVIAESAPELGITGNGRDRQGRAGT